MADEPAAIRHVEHFIELLTIRSQSSDHAATLQRLQELPTKDAIAVAVLSIGFQVGVINGIALTEGHTLPEAIATVARLVWDHYYATHPQE